MRKTILATLTAAALVIGGGVASAQFSNIFWNGHQDNTLPESPCGVNNTADVDPFVVGGEIWAMYQCHLGPDFVRRYAVTPPASTSPVPTVTPPASSCTTINPGPAFTCVNGNWIYTG